MKNGKKLYFMLITACLFVLLITGCGKTDTVPQAGGSADNDDTLPETGGSVGIANPRKELESSADFEPIFGFTIESPEGAESVKYTSIDGTIAEVAFNYDGKACSYRASSTESNIAGIYYPLVGDAAEVAIKTAAGDTVTLTVELTESGTLIKWSLSDRNYTLWCENNTDKDSAVALAEKLVK